MLVASRSRQCSMASTPDEKPKTIIQNLAHLLHIPKNTAYLTIICEIKNHTYIHTHISWQKHWLWLVEFLCFTSSLSSAKTRKARSRNRPENFVLFVILSHRKGRCKTGVAGRACLPSSVWTSTPSFLLFKNMFTMQERHCLSYVDIEFLTTPISSTNLAP